MKRIYFIALLAISCDDLELIDTSAPAVDVTVPDNGGEIIAGEFAHFEAKFTDDFEKLAFSIGRFKDI